MRKITILTTGGTIAGSSDSMTAATGYTIGTTGTEALLASVPQLREYAEIVGEEVCNIDSKDMTEAIWLRLAARVEALLAQEDVDGVVITHGTDTMEETAYFLHLTVHSEKPIVLVGAMRPATALSADGPMNLLHAVRVASAAESRGRGVLVVMSDQILGAREVRKQHTTATAAFLSAERLGEMQDGVPTYYRDTTRRHTTASPFSVAGVEALPDVPILYGYVGDKATMVDALVAAGARGIVYAGTGNGSIPAHMERALARASAAGVVVVRSARTMSGAVIPAEASYREARFLDGDDLSPQKAKILLQLALLQTTDCAEIQRMLHTH